MLDKTPHEIAVIVAHQAIDYGTIIKQVHDGQVLPELKRAVFKAVKQTIEHSAEAEAVK